MSALPKPVLRGHIHRRGIRTIIGAVTFAGITGASYYLFVTLPRRHKYEEFLKTYDAEAHYEILAKGGYLQSSRKT